MDRILRAWRRLVVAAGLLAIAVGLVFAFVPGSVPSGVLRGIDDLVTTTGPATLSLAVAALFGLYALVRVWLDRTAEPDEAFGDRRASPYSGLDQSAGPSHVTGSDVDATLAWAAASTTGDAHPGHLDDAKDRLRTVLSAVLERSGEYADGTEQQTIEHAIAAGTWTDDTVAAVFLGDETNEALPDLPLWRRLYAWLSPTRAFRRQYERTLAAVEDRCADTVSGYSRPEPVVVVESSGGFDRSEDGTDEVARW
ncbi:DUF7269 family protein [Haloarchaeobius sp. DFWS5]|uniref:DUF7269 family protein n=1 Tax=Haloarchaeobius sp. DFWS5 TaxID=3446114 RepID=UPI003EBEC84F